MKKFLLAITFNLLFLFFPSIVFASTSFTLDQDNFLLQTSLEKPITETLIVKNLTDQKLDLTAEWNGYSNSIEHSIDFATIAQTKLTIEPFAITSLTVGFTPPKNLVSGDYYGFLKLKSPTETKTADFTLRILGKLSESVESNNVSLSGNNLTVYFKNTGNITSTIKGNLTISNFFGQEILNKNIDPFSLKASASGTKDFVLDTNIPGPYQVKVETSFGKKATTQTNVSTVWYLNLWLITMFFLIVIELSIVFILFKRRHAKEKSSP